MTNTVRLGEVAVTVEGLSKSYDEITALERLDLSIGSGTIFGLLGPNGAGKSTTVKILTTLSRPNEGRARVGGIDVLDAPEEVRKVVGYVAQKSGADAQATGTENLVLQARIHGLDRKTSRQRAAELLERFGLVEHSDRKVKTWSGGLRRRLDIALALVHKPKVLFLDEPTTGLDPEARVELWEEIRTLRDHDEVTVLLTTHYLEEADRLADRLAIIDHGTLVAEGTPIELKDAMRGDGVHIELSSIEMTPKALAVLEEVGVRDLVVENRVVHGRTDRAAEAIPRILISLNQSQVEVREVSVTRPSLDDVFLRHTGRRYANTEMEPST